MVVGFGVDRVRPDVVGTHFDLGIGFDQTSLAPLAVRFGGRLVSRFLNELPKLAERDFVLPQIVRLAYGHWQLWSFGFHPRHLPTQCHACEDSFDLRLAGAHQELARRNQAELHADGVGVFDWHSEVPGPGILMCLRLGGVERGDGERRRDGRHLVRR